jgi:hypothetical protein
VELLAMAAPETDRGKRSDDRRPGQTPNDHAVAEPHARATTLWIDLHAFDVVQKEALLFERDSRTILGVLTGDVTQVLAKELRSDPLRNLALGLLEL